MEKILNVFWSKSEHRLRAAWRLIIQGIMSFFLQIVASIPLGIIAAIVMVLQGQVMSQDQIMGSPVLLYGNMVVGLISFVPAVWMAGRWLDRRKFKDFGFHLSLNWWLDFGFGLALGAVLMAIIFLVELQLGWVTIQEYWYVSPKLGNFATGIIFSALLFLSVGFYEELFSRGYHIKNLSEGLNFGKKNPRLGIALAVVVSSLFFGLMHAGNPNATFISSFNIALAGIFLGLGYLLTGELAIPIGLHITWNFFQGSVFGFPVSGTNTGVSVIQIQQLGPDRWTGATFGPEAGYIGLLTILLGCLLTCLYVWIRYGKVKLALSLTEFIPRKVFKTKEKEKGVVKMEKYSANLLLDSRSALGEGPAWDARVGKLYWVNIMGAEVHVFDPKTNEDRVIDLSNQFSDIGTLAPSSDPNKVLIAPDMKIGLLDLTTEEVEILAEVEGEKERFNDGKCGPAGNFIVGTMHESDPLGKLVNYTPQDGVSVVMDSGVKTSNGLGWSPDHKTMYYVDSKYKEMYAFDYDLETGALSNKRVAFKLPEGDYSPDGLTTDKEGMIWLAWWQGFCITRWNPVTGEMIGKVDVPAPQVTACCFGGDEMTTLYITSARAGLGDETLEKYPHAGSLFVLETDIEGQPAWEFKL